MLSAIEHARTSLKLTVVQDASTHAWSEGLPMADLVITLDDADGIDRVVSDRAEVARRLRLTRARVTQLLDLTLLAP